MLMYSTFKNLWYSLSVEACLFFENEMLKNSVAQMLYKFAVSSPPLSIIKIIKTIKFQNTLFV